MGEKIKLETRDCTKDLRTGKSEEVAQRTTLIK